MYPGYIPTGLATNETFDSPVIGLSGSVIVVIGFTVRVLSYPHTNLTEVVWPIGFTVNGNAALSTFFEVGAAGVTVGAIPTASGVVNDCVADSEVAEELTVITL